MRKAAKVKDKAIFLKTDVVVKNNVTGKEYTGHFVCGMIVGIRFRTIDDDGTPCEMWLKDIINGDYTVTTTEY